MLAIGTDVVGACHAQEVVAVLGVVHRVRVVVVAHREEAVEDFAAHDVVLDVALAVAPGEKTVVILLEAHHDARLVHIAKIVDRVGEHVPTDVAGRVDDGVLREEVPLKGAAHRVVPDGARADAGLLGDVVDEVEAVLEFRINLLHFGAEERMALGFDAGDFRVRGRRVELIRVLEVFGLAAQRAGVAHLDHVDVVGIEAEDGNAAVGKQFGARDLVFDRLAVELGLDLDDDVAEVVAAVADDGRKRRNAVRVHHDFTDVALHDVVRGRTRAAAHGKRPHGSGRNARGDQAFGKESHFGSPIGQKVGLQ